MAVVDLSALCGSVSGQCNDFLLYDHANTGLTVLRNKRRTHTRKIRTSRHQASCDAWRLADYYYATTSKLSPDTLQQRWRSALKRPGMSGYDLFMSEAIPALMDRDAEHLTDDEKRQLLHDLEPSVSGGWSSACTRRKVKDKYQIAIQLECVDSGTHVKVTVLPGNKPLPPRQDTWNFHRRENLSDEWSTIYIGPSPWVDESILPGVTYWYYVSRSTKDYVFNSPDEWITCGNFACIATPSEVWCAYLGFDFTAGVNIWQIHWGTIEQCETDCFAYLHIPDHWWYQWGGPDPYPFNTRYLTYKNIAVDPAANPFEVDVHIRGCDEDMHHFRTCSAP